MILDLSSHFNVRLMLFKYDDCKEEFIFDDKKRYEILIKEITNLIEGKIDSIEYEERCRSMFGTSAYLVYTIDKLCQSITKQVLFSFLFDYK